MVIPINRCAAYDTGSGPRVELGFIPTRGFKPAARRLSGRSGAARQASLRDVPSFGQRRNQLRWPHSFQHRPRPIVTIELISIISAAIVVVIIWLAIRDLKPPRK